MSEESAQVHGFDEFNQALCGAKRKNGMLFAGNIKDVTCSGCLAKTKEK